MQLDGSILTWVFPTMLISYYTAQWWVARHYGNDLSCDGSDAGIPLRWRMLILAVLMGLVMWLAYRRHDALDAGMAIGIGVSGAFVALARGFIYWRRHHAQPGR